MPPNSSDSKEPQEPAERSTGAGRSDAAFSRELARCLIELSIAIHKHAMYPADHPLLGPAAARVTESVNRLLQERATLSLGVARDQLIIEGVATDSHNPVLRELAGRLHHTHLGAVPPEYPITSGCSPFIVMMKPADLRDGTHFPPVCSLDGPWPRSLHSQGEMGAPAVIVIKVST